VTDTATWWLVGFTGSLTIATSSLAFATFRAVRVANRTAAAAEADVRQGQVLVEVTQEQVKAAQRQADLTQRALDAERQPLLLPKSAAGSGPVVTNPATNPQTMEGIWLVVHLRNVGPHPGAVRPR